MSYDVFNNEVSSDIDLEKFSYYRVVRNQK